MNQQKNGAARRLVGIAATACLFSPLWASAGSVSITTTLDASSPTYMRPMANNGPCTARTTYHKFTAADFVVDTTAANYSMAVPAGGGISDPYALLYVSPFTASLPMVNCLTGDDDNGGGRNSLIFDVGLQAGKVYTAIITTYDASETGTLTATLNGAGNFTRLNGFIKATATWTAGNNVVLDLRLSSNGVATTDSLRWVAVPPDSTPPTFAEVIAGQQSGGAPAPTSGALNNLPLNSDISRSLLPLPGARPDLYITLYNGGLNGTVRVLDFTPTAPVFTAQTGALPSATVSSNQVALGGFTEAVAISVSGGEYRIGSGAFTSTPGTALPGDLVTVRLTSAATVSTPTTATLTVGGVPADFTVTTTDPITAVCGTAHGQTFSTLPTTQLCSPGNAGAVSAASGQFSWTCAGLYGGGDATCNASWSDTASGGNQGVVTAPAAVANNNWVVTNAGFVAPPVAPPAGSSFPFGLASVQLASGTPGTAASFTINYATAVPAGAVYMKYGRSPAGFNCTGAACNLPHWYELPANQVAFSPDRLSVTLTITDGGVGDDDLLPNGVITDPGGPVVMGASAVTGIPTLSEWGMIIMASLMALGAFASGRRRR